MITLVYNFQSPKKTADVVLNANNHSYEGHCNDTDAHFLVKWNEEGNPKRPNHTFLMSFYDDVNESKWDVTKIKARFETSDSYAFHDAKENSKFSYLTVDL